MKVEKATDYIAIASYGVASTLGLVINGRVFYAGCLPKARTSPSGWHDAGLHASQ